MTQLLPNGKQQFTDNNGKPLVNGKVFHYFVGTNNPKTTYQDSGETIPNTNPVILNSRGEASIYGTGNYRQVLQTASGSTIWDQVILDPGKETSDALATFITDLGNTTDPQKGSQFVGNADALIQTLIAAQAKSGWSVGQKFHTGGYYTFGDGGSNSYEVVADGTGTVDGGSIVQGVGVRFRGLFQDGAVRIDQFGAKKGDTGFDSTPAILAAIAFTNVPIIGNGTYRCNSNIQVLRDFFMLIGYGGSSRLEFATGAGLVLGNAIFANPNKTGSTKVRNISLRSFQVQGVTSYTGDLIHLAYADEITMFDVISAPTNTNLGDGSLSVGLKVSWVQWLSTYRCRFGGNQAAMYINLTRHNQDNEDHFHFYATEFYLQKHLPAQITGAVYTRFALGRSNGCAEVSFNGCHLGEFAESSNRSFGRAFVIDLNGNTTDKKVFRSAVFSACMLEQAFMLVDTFTLQNGFTGKDTSCLNFYGTAFIGNSFATDTAFRGDTFKTRVIIDSCTGATITTFENGPQMSFRGACDFATVTTLLTNSVSYHEFVGARPVPTMRTNRNLAVTLPNAATSVTFAHGLSATPNRIAAITTHNSTWWVSARDATNVTLSFGTAPVGDQSLQVAVEIHSTMG